MTIHSAKGLEFSCVFIAGLEEELFPSIMSFNTQKDLEEERRLFYVAITRAKEYLFISYAVTRFKWGLLNHCIPSRFVSEISEEFLEKDQTLSSPVKTKIPSYEKAPSISTVPFSKTGKMIKVSSVANKENENRNDNILSGMDVEHERFGKGKVISREGTAPNIKVTVFFKDHGQKQLLLKFARLKIIS